MSDYFLTDNELTTLCGAVHKAKRIKWLKDNQYLFNVNEKGQPVVLRSHVNAMLGGTSTIKEPQLNL